ncbi:hypothetical protein NQ317_017537 [Molorchus minor]|uniref:CCHC-type domain-containing protein n=1 Tax=Molorchus minor TaxID=1323400 RepID=A0ABQ9JUV3_9CUCU|nr:hypothetical protein NQ317_017537 [Molorchus minor]
MQKAVDQLKEDFMKHLSLRSSAEAEFKYEERSCMPVITRTRRAEMEESIKQIMDMMKEMKQGQDAIKEEMKQGQDAIKEEMKQGQDAIKEEMKDAIKEEMKQCQDEMKNEVTRQLQDQGNKFDQQVGEILTNMKTELHTRFEYMEKVVEETVEEFKNEMDKEITDMKKDVEVLNNKIDKGLVDVKKEIDILKRKCESQKSGTINVEEGYHHSSKIKPPTYDGKTSWQTYLKQFDAVANVNNCSTTGDEVWHDKHLQQVYQAQLKGRNQRINENLQQYEADIARLVYLAYPTAPRDFIEQLAVQVFIDGIRDCETQQALRLARCKKLNDLAYALEFEAAKQASRGHTRIRQIRTRTPEREYRSSNSYNTSNFKDDVENLRQNIKDIQTSLENIVEQADRRNQTTSFRRKVPLECWNCGEKGHIRPRCPRLGSEQAPVQRQVEDQGKRQLVISRLRNDGTSLVVYGKVCGRDCQMVIDTGSYHTIVKPNILAHCKMKPTTNNFILETAGVNITDDVLMGLELMKKHGFQLNLQERSIKTGQDEIIISMPRSDEKVRRITLTEDVILPALSETIVMVNLEPGEDDGQVELIEPDLDEDIVKKGLLVAKTLTQRKNNTVPVRLVNPKNCDQKLKNGDVLVIPSSNLHNEIRTAVVNDDNWETKKLCEEQQKDEDIKPFIAWKEEGTRPEWKDISNKSTTLKGYWAIWDSLIVENGILKRLWENTDGKEIRKQIVLPRARVNEVLQEVHGGVGGGVELMSKIGVDGVLSVPVAKDQEPEAEGK